MTSNMTCHYLHKTCTIVGHQQSIDGGGREKRHQTCSLPAPPTMLDPGSPTLAAMVNKEEVFDDTVEEPVIDEYKIQKRNHLVFLI